MKKRYVLLILILVIASIWFYFSLPKKYSYRQPDMPETFDEFYEQELAESAKLNARPGNEQKLIRFKEKTPIALLYIHGFSASRAEGEFVVDSLANLYQANTYYMRLPGHGTNKQDHADAKFSDYLDNAITTLHMMQELGDTVIIVGTSMGGLVATYLAAEYPDLVDGLLLTSPFYDYASGMGNLLKIPGVLPLMVLKDGNDRHIERVGDWATKVQPGYDDYWYPDQYYTALQSLEELRRFASRDQYFEKIEQPVLILAYYKDEENQDGAASVKAMEETLSKFSSTKNSTGNKLVKLPDAEHVMMSRYVTTDKDTIFKTIQPFIEQFMPETPAPQTDTTWTP